MTIALGKPQAAVAGVRNLLPANQKSRNVNSQKNVARPLREKDINNSLLFLVHVFHVSDISYYKNSGVIVVTLKPLLLTLAALLVDVIMSRLDEERAVGALIKNNSVIT